MGMFDELKDKAEALIGEHPDQVEKLSDQLLDKAADAVDSATGGKFSDKIEMAAEKADDAIGE